MIVFKLKATQNSFVKILKGEIILAFDPNEAIKEHN